MLQKIIKFNFTVQLIKYHLNTTNHSLPKKNLNGILVFWAMIIWSALFQGFKSFGLWKSVTARVVPNIFKDHIVFTFTGKQIYKYVTTVSSLPTFQRDTYAVIINSIYPQSLRENARA